MKKDSSLPYSCGMVRDKSPKLKMYSVAITITNVQATSEADAINEATLWVKRNPAQYGVFEVNKQ